jgi:hypothetical protein
MPQDHSSAPRETASRFEKQLAELARGGVDFAVVGDIAILLNGALSLTLDAAIIVGDSPDNIRRMLQCLERWGEGWARELKPEDFVPQEGSIRVMEEFDLDIFTRLKGKSLDDFRSRLRHLESGDVRIPYLAPEDLLSLKQGSSRQKDQLDVAAMKEIIERERKTKG